MDYALVTGATKGIGRAISECLAEKGYNLLLVARTEALLKKNSADWRQRYEIDVRYLALDLENPEASGFLSSWVEEQNVPLKALVNNAGFGLWGPFQEIPLENQTQMLQLNMVTPFRLIHYLIPLLQENAPAYILNVGSLAGLLAMPSVSAYSASKAFVNTFTRGLHHELKPLHISVTALIPGLVDTHFNEVAGMEHIEKKSRLFTMNAEEVAKAAVDAMFKKKIAVIPGFPNLAMAFLVKHLPSFWVEKMALTLFRKKQKGLISKR